MKYNVLDWLVVSLLVGGVMMVLVVLVPGLVVMYEFSEGHSHLVVLYFVKLLDVVSQKT